MEKWIRTLEEQRTYLHDFETLDEACELIGPFTEDYNGDWLIEPRTSDPS